MRILFIKSTTAINYGYLPETVDNIDDKLADKFIRQGYAIPFPGETFTKIPKDFPYRHDFFNAGIVCMEQINSLPANHSLNSPSSSYGISYPKTTDLLKQYENKDLKKKPEQDVIY